jgi:hypothetical protein
MPDTERHLLPCPHYYRFVQVLEPLDLVYVPFPPALYAVIKLAPDGKPAYSIIVEALSNVTLVRPVQTEKAPFPMRITLLGMVMPTRLVQP